MIYYVIGGVIVAWVGTGAYLWRTRFPHESWTVMLWGPIPALLTAGGGLRS